MHRDWNDAYANMAHVPGSAELPALWAARAAEYRAGPVRIDTDIAYGTAPRERLDLVWPEGSPRGLAVFIHGGYWIRMDKSLWTHLAEGARQRGWAVALPQYTLAPEARIAEITRQMGVAIALAAERVAGPIRIAGHSAGGHLATRMVCADNPLPAAVQARVQHVLSISGLHDLRPLMWTDMNAEQRIDEAEALRESPALLRPAEGARVTAWVGGGERPDFIRQAQLLALIWGGLGAQITCEVDSTHNHFTVIEALCDPNSALTLDFVGV